MTDAEDLTFDEEAAMEAARERSVPHPRDILKREHDRILKGHRRDVAMEKIGSELESLIMRDLHAPEKQ
jgi:hypothetical protein